MRFSIILLAAVSGVSAFGQNADPAARPLRPANGRVIGEVTGVDQGARKLSVKADAGGAYEISLDAGTSLRRVPFGAKDTSSATPTTLGEIQNGDRVIARGSISEAAKTMAASSVILMSKAELAKKAEFDRAEWQKRGIVGTVSAVDPAAKSVTVKIASRGEKKELIVTASDKTNIRRYAPDSTRFSDAGPSSLAEIQNGDQLRALVNKDAGGTHREAEEIVFGTFHNIAAQVMTVDAAANEIKVKDLDTKKPVIVRIRADSMLRRLPEQFARMMAMRVQRQAAGVQGGPGTGVSGAGMRGGMAANGEFPGGRPGGGSEMGGMRNGPPDIQETLERMPVLTPAELKSGDALIILTTAGSEGKKTAVIMLAGVEPILTAAPQDRGQTLGGAWNLGGDAGVPMQ